MHQQQLRVFMYNTVSLRKTDYFEIFSAMLSLEESTTYFSLKLLLEKWCDCLTENCRKNSDYTNHNHNNDNDCTKTCALRLIVL